MFKPSQLSIKRKRIVLAVVLVIAASGSLVSGMLFHQESSVDIEVEVVNHSDPANMHRVTSISIKVENKEPHPIRPQFNTIHGQFQTVSSLEISHGPDILNPGETEIYEIRAPIPNVGIPYEEKAILTVNDKETSRTHKSTIRFNKSAPEPILNPGLRSWQKDRNKPYFEPYRWSGTESSPGAEQTEIDHDGSTASLTASNVTRKDGPWAMSGLTQQITFPQTLYIKATPQTVVEEPSKYPPRATGVELGENNHRVWVVFANVSERQVFYRSGKLSYIFVYIPASSGDLVETTVNVTRLYDRYNWDAPEVQTREIDGVAYTGRTARILAFAAVYPDNPTQNSAVQFDRLVADTESNFTAAQDNPSS